MKIINNHWLWVLPESSSLIFHLIISQRPRVFPRKSVLLTFLSSLLSCWFPLLRMDLGSGDLLLSCPGYVLTCPSCKIWSWQSSVAFLVILTMCFKLCSVSLSSVDNDFSNLVSHKYVPVCLGSFMRTTWAFSCSVLRSSRDQHWPGHLRISAQAQRRNASLSFYSFFFF